MMDSSVTNHRMITRSKLIEESDKPAFVKDGPKRSADHLPDAGNKKRILGDITNQPKAANLKSNVTARKGSKSSKHDSENSLPHFKSEHSLSKSTISEDSPKQIETSIGDSFYTTAVDVSPTSSIGENKMKEEIVQNPIPEGVEDFDKSCQKDPFSESRYVADIFNYYLKREKLFSVRKYLDRQKDMTKGMRAILVDWMVEVQESFELNHETLYLAVKLVDRYLMKHFVKKSELQLVGATAICIAAKFDERQPPLVDDFLYICDDSYTREQLIETEIKILQTVNFDLGIPLSYRFLRRFARCSRMSMPELTLARYILETSLMDYDLIDILDSKLASAALFLAIKMSNQDWTSTHEYYTGYTERDLKDLVYSLNKLISAPLNSHLQTIRTKYSHKVFFEVSKIPPLCLIKPTN